MPLIRVQTSISALDADTTTNLLQSLSASLSQHLSKPETYVMTAMETDRPMTMSGSTGPTCLVEIKNVGSIDPSKTQAMTQSFCQLLSDQLGIPQNRIYVLFDELKPTLWGWNGTTLG